MNQGGKAEHFKSLRADSSKQRNGIYPVHARRTDEALPRPYEPDVQGKQHHAYNPA